MVAGDYFSLKGSTWLVLVDRFSGWVSVFHYPQEATASDLVKTMKSVWCTFGVPENFASDNGTQFMSHIFQSFLKEWGVTYHRVSSSYFPHSNLRAETAVKSAKRILLNNTKSDGSPIWDKIYKALMAHRNTPDLEWKLSPAQLIFGRPVRDFLPVNPGNFHPSEVWVNCRDSRESAMAHRVHLGRERWEAHTRNLSPLQLGQNVAVQNQQATGKAGKRWDRTGTVIEDLGHHKYRIKIDGSGRVTDRNRRFLRSFKPAVSKSFPGPSPTTSSSVQEQEPTLTPEVSNPESPNMPHEIPDFVNVENTPTTTSEMGGEGSSSRDPCPFTPPAVSPTHTSSLSPPSSDIQSLPNPRRSSRARVPNKLYSKDFYDLTRE